MIYIQYNDKLINYQQLISMITQYIENNIIQ
jgi:hypothetical protein